jgi:hypothetical protein
MTTAAATFDPARLEAFAGRVFGAANGALELLTAYLMSVLHCLPTALAQQPSAGLGAIVRESTLRELAAEAGFASFAVAPFDHPMVRFYELMA